MKLRLTLLSASLVASLGMFAQSSLCYSLARPIDGGDMVLLETDLNTNSETVIGSYAPSTLDDYDPGSTTFDHQNGRFIALGSDLDENVSIVGLNTSTGAIDYSHTSSNYWLNSVEYSNGNVYSVAEPLGGSDLVLLQTNAASGSETVIATYSSAVLDDYDPGSTTFDHDNGRFIVLGSDTDGTVSVVGLNTTTGDIDYSHTSSNYELYSIEYANGKVYSLARPMGGGDMVLLSTDLSTGAETVVDTYPSAELDDYDPGATSFDHQYGQFVALASDLTEMPFLVSLNATTGDVDFEYDSTSYELFSIESAGDGTVGLNDVTQSDDAFSIYPNPAQELLTLQNVAAYEKLEIVDMLGTLVFTSTNKETEINVSFLAPGSYLVSISRAGLTHTTRLLKL